MNIETLNAVVDALTELGQYSLWGFCLWLLFDLLPKILLFIFAFTTLIYAKKIIDRLITEDSIETKQFYMDLRTEIMPSRDYGDLTPKEIHAIHKEVMRVVHQHTWSSLGTYKGYRDDPNVPETHKPTND